MTGQPTPKKTAMVCLDGFGYDYLKRTDFLRDYVKSGQWGKSVPTFAYSSTFSALTGSYPDEHGNLAGTFFAEKGPRLFSYFRWLDIPGLKSLKALPFILYNLGSISRGNLQLKFLPNIPLKYMRHFDFTLKCPIFKPGAFKKPTIFELMAQKGLKVSGYHWPYSFQGGKSSFAWGSLGTSTKATDAKAFSQSLKMIPKSDFHYLHLFGCDHCGHEFGKDSTEMDEKIQEYDDYIQKLSELADSLILFSDHGMVNVDSGIDVGGAVRSTGHEFGKDYLMFLDSTLARFKFFNGAAKQEILSALPKGGHVLSEKEKKEAHIPAPQTSNGFGDEFYLADPGNLVLPNFYQDRTCKAMHGYACNTEPQKGFYFVSGAPKEREISITELLGLALEL